MFVLLFIERILKFCHVQTIQWGLLNIIKPSRKTHGCCQQVETEPIPFLVIDVRNDEEVAQDVLPPELASAIRLPGTVGCQGVSIPRCLVRAENRGQACQIAECCKLTLWQAQKENPTQFLSLPTGGEFETSGWPVSPVWSHISCPTPHHRRRNMNWMAHYRR